MNTIFRPILSACAILAALAAINCGGGGGGSLVPATPTAPTAPTTPTSPASVTALTVNILGSSSNSAFSPNPIAANVGQTVAFKNNDGTVHHLVADNGSWTTGDIAAGATSSALSISSTSAVGYHCTIHATMVGSINGALAPPDPTPNASGGYDY